MEDEREQRLIKNMEAMVAEDAEKRDEAIIKETAEDCPFRISMMAHSMGCYLVRKIFDDFTPPPDFGFLDNIVLLAADTNNPGHGTWVDQLNPRQGVYVTINQNDSALALSERKLGRKQLARLGRLARNLESPGAVYVDFSRGKAVLKKPHAYFEDEVISANAKVKRFFRAAFHGQVAEHGLPRASNMNAYQMH